MMLFSGLLLVVLSNFLIHTRCEYIDPADCKVVFYYGPSYDDSVSYPLSSAEQVFSHPKYSHVSTVLFIPDYYEPQLEGYQSHYTIDSYLKSDTTNTLFLDWGGPVTSADKVKDPKVSELVPMTTSWLMKAHDLTDWDAFHVLAYAKGAEFIANVVTDLFRKSQMRIHRITQLAPPQEFIVDGQQVNEDKDLITTFIDAIHTDIGDQGANVSRAHVDFYPNGGTAPQPGCPDEGLCSRRRAFRFYAESVNSPFSFCSFKADSYDELKGKQHPQLGAPVPMGRACFKIARDKYFVDTNDDAPFGRGC